MVRTDLTRGFFLKAGLSRPALKFGENLFQRNAFGVKQIRSLAWMVGIFGLGMIAVAVLTA